MNNTLNFNRIGLLIKRQWLEFGRIYLATLGIITVIIVAFYGYIVINNISYGRIYPGALFFREPLFIILGLLYITIVSTNYFAHLGQKPKATIDLLIPASASEKLITGVIFTSILSFFIYVFIFNVVDMIFVNRIIAHYHYQESLDLINRTAKIAPKQSSYLFKQYLQKDHRLVSTALSCVSILISSIFFLGSIYFNKFHYIKTLVSIITFGAIYMAIMAKYVQIIFKGKMSIVRTESMSENQTMWMVFSVVLLFTIIFYIISYIRLKEKEV